VKKKTNFTRRVSWYHRSAKKKVLRSFEGKKIAESREVVGRGPPLSVTKAPTNTPSRLGLSTEGRKPPRKIMKTGTCGPYWTSASAVREPRPRTTNGRTARTSTGNRRTKFNSTNSQIKSPICYSVKFWISRRVGLYFELKSKAIAKAKAKAKAGHSAIADHSTMSACRM